ncbi:MAG: hypothetical protein KDD40_11900, partial [Bdellovibrionales bacterium]|nr:hypothetical protein [Bdellovibrionales bacterium]
EDDEEEAELASLSRFLLLATEGKARSLREAKKYVGEKSELPLVMIATPEEWDELESKYHKEYEMGLFDNFEINRTFQTSPWTMWPPYSDKATPVVKDLAKLPISKEEKKVFPTLETLLNEIVTGGSHGKQRIVIIPEDLKKLVTKLIVGRWASSNAKNSDDRWSHSNEQLSLFMINGSRDDNRQENIVDNFDAMRGAAETRSVGLIGTLEDVIRIGRPYSSFKEFRIKDPASNTGLDLYADKPAQKSSDDSELDDGEEDITASSLQLLIEDRDTLTDELRDWESGDSLTSDEQAEVEKIKHRLAVIQAFIDRQLEENGDKLGGVERESVDESNATALPHLMWWIAAEGKLLQPKKTKGWDISQEVDGVVSTLLVGTREEFHTLEQEMSFESKFFDLEKHFEILELTPPTADVKFSLVNSLFNRNEIRSLEYNFQLEDKSGEQAKSQLIYFLINRAEQIAIQEGQEQTSAFVRTFSELRRS